ncbi:MAG: 16S rRNA (cytosine(1402)-N(4))-methyltransferase RsmH [Endomicrobiaceae bacterium]
MNNAFYHLPVMAKEVSEYLITAEDGFYIDCTFGGGGHSLYLLENNEKINIIAFDQDEDSFNNFNSNDKFSKVKERIIFIRDNFRNILKDLEKIKINKVNGLFADLGVSSKQLDDMGRGFSFRSNEILDMRMDRSKKLTAYDVVNTYSAEKLREIFFKYGEESFAGQIAEKIAEYRIKGSIKTCSQLTDIVCGVKWVKGKINPATKIFQALRIYVNDELASLQEMLSSIPEILSDRARAVVLTYHSLEDRMVKQTFKSFHSQGLEIVNKKIIIATDEEIKNNHRSRSAKMRVVEKGNG